MPRYIRAAFAAVLLVVLAASPVLAHATINPNEAPADSYARFAFRIGHGCEGSPTTEIAIQIPDGVVSVKPEMIPGWQYETVVGEYSEPVVLHGEEITEGVREVRWFGGPPIPDEAFQEFGLSVRLPDAAGETLYFPVVQTCEEGEHAWIEVPDDGGSADELEEPAPALTLTSGDAAHGAQDDEPSNADAVSEDVTLTSAALSDAEAAASQARALAIVALVAAVVIGSAAVVLARRS